MVINPLVSIIISTKNEEKNILRCLKALKKQTYPKIEIILVDNHSEDQTVQIAKKYVDKVIVTGPERSIQRNIGAKKAKGAWLLFLDADMIALPNLVKDCTLLTNRDHHSMVVVRVEPRGETFLGKALALELLCNQDALWLWGARFFNRQDFAKIGGYDKNLVAGEDWDITQRLLDKGVKMLVNEKPQALHYESDAPLFKLLEKEVYYIKNIHKYSVKHPKAFAVQSGYYRIITWFKSWRLLLKHPILTLTFISYKFLVWLIWIFVAKLKFDENKLAKAFYSSK